MTPADIVPLLRAAKPGSIISLAGIFQGALRLSAWDFGGVVLDLTDAEFPDGGVINGAKGLALRGGRWGRTDSEVQAFHTLQVANVEDFSLSGATVVGNGNSFGGGISIANSARVTVRDSQFDGHSTALGVRTSSDILVTGNRITGSAADGINVTDCQRGIISANECRDFRPAVGAHPDAIQLRSVAGRPLQADIWLLNNLAIGRMQAFFGGEYRTHWHGNYAATNGYTHTVSAATGARECSAFDNVLANTPDAPHGPGRLKGFEDASNREGRNVLWDSRRWGMPARRWAMIVPPIAASVGSRFEDRAFGPVSVEGGVP